MKVGIEKLNLYAGRCYLDLAELAAERGEDLEYLHSRVMCQERTVIPLFEDAVTLAVNAAKPILTPEDIADIELVIASTESSVDFGKPISNWVHRYCGLSANCRSFEIKHACYAGTAAVKMACAWVTSFGRPGKKALVVCTDYSRPPDLNNAEIQFEGHSPEFITGGGAVAMIIGADPAVAEIETAKAGYWTNEIDDSYRPTSRTEAGDQLKSLYSYLDALDGAFEHYEEVVGPVEDYDSEFQAHIYHAPFPGMALQAHLSMLGRFGVNKAEATVSFCRKVEPGIRFAKRVGSIYGASNFVSLLGLLQRSSLNAGDRISMFAYGAGCQGEFSSARVGSGAQAYVRSRELDRHLDSRVRVGVPAYEAIERLRYESIDARDWTPDRGVAQLFEQAYAGQGLLVLDKIENYRRDYAWS